LFIHWSKSNKKQKAWGSRKHQRNSHVAIFREGTEKCSFTPYRWEGGPMTQLCTLFHIGTRRDRRPRRDPFSNHYEKPQEIVAPGTNGQFQRFYMSDGLSYGPTSVQEPINMVLQYLEPSCGCRRIEGFQPKPISFTVPEFCLLLHRQM
jgi:hypothetical protein